MKLTTVPIVIALALVALPRANSAPIYEITTLGLQGVEHTRNDGYLFSAAQQMNLAGQVVGYSERYNGGSMNLGLSVWMFDGSTVHHIGFFDTEHTRNNGFKKSVIASVNTGDGPLYWFNEAGYVAGHSERYDGLASGLGQSAWVSNGSTTVKVGLTDAEHTSLGGTKVSSISRLNRRGQAAGRSNRYGTIIRGPQLGNSAWFYDGTATKKVGLVGPEHTSNDGVKESVVAGLTDGGQVVGTSIRYQNGGGQSVWRYDGSTTNDIGLVDAAHSGLAEHVWTIKELIERSSAV